ncbi:hypothetical protein C0Q70_17899 [Pomacea canaliculata]|uniref:Uncharacterized protein n=1 Tax=Pomacea canaliculata TaxID=400727 RepID=A0A2T7NLQ9_POMCA|nr:hypothetical protein C0Q70_17899 [Pomacea canaliculata]
MEAIALALDNTQPAAAGSCRSYIMHTFEKPKECDVCGKLLRGIFFQGYLNQDNNMAVHKECIGKPDKTKNRRPPRPPQDKGETNKEVYKAKATMHYRGLPLPPPHMRPPLAFEKDDVVEVLSQTDSEWWKVGPVQRGRRLLSFQVVTIMRLMRKESYLPVHKDGRVVSNGDSSPVYRMSPSPSTLPPPAPHAVQVGPEYVNDPNNLHSYMWYVGEMERPEAQKQLDACPDGTFLIRVTNNPARKGELSLSIKFANAVRHIKVNRSPQNRFYLADGRYFDSVQGLVDYYEKNELADSFPDVATTLRIPYKSVAIGTRILGYAQAVYDYSATSTSQVTLKNGDRIAILSKNGQDKGWWKGENLRTQKVGYFPLAYVDEEET